MTTPSTQTKALLALIDTIVEAVQAAGPMGVPEGHLYAALMSIPNFRAEHLSKILDLLVKAGKVSRSGFLVKAVL